MALIVAITAIATVALTAFVGFMTFLALAPELSNHWAGTFRTNADGGPTLESNKAD